MHAFSFTDYTESCVVNETATETTCNYLLDRWELTVSDFVALNDNVDDACDDLVIGEPVRLTLFYTPRCTSLTHTL